MILWFKHIKKPRPVSSERGWSRESQFVLLNSVMPLSDNSWHRLYAILMCDVSRTNESEPGGTRTHDPRLKRQLLYQLSYRFS